MKAITSSDVNEQLVKHGLTPMPVTQEQLAATIKRESVMWAKVIKDGKITTE